MNELDLKNKKIKNIPTKGGTYILFISLYKNIEIKIGSLGLMIFYPGTYLYVGSALGPGGLLRRIERHLSSKKKTFWHIDYFLNNQKTSISLIGYLISDNKNECRIVKQLNSFSFISTNNFKTKFGSSDCNCKSHLFYIQKFKEKDILDQLISSFKKQKFSFIRIN